MKIGLFLLYGFICFVVSGLTFFTLNGGIERVKDDSGYSRFKIAGTIEPKDWLSVFVLSIAAGLLASIATSAVWSGLLALICALPIMGYVTYRACQEVSKPVEVFLVVILLLVFYFIGGMGVISGGGLIRNAFIAKLLWSFPGIELSICIGIIVSSVLKYRADGGHLVRGERMSRKTAKNYRTLSAVVMVIAAIIAIVILIKVFV